MMSLGMLVALVGIDLQVGIPRFDSGQLYLWNGVDLIPIVVGLFGGAEVQQIMLSKKSIATVGVGKFGGAEGADFSFDDLSYIGRVGAEDTLVLEAADSEYGTWQRLLDSDGFRFGSTGLGASDYITPTILMEAFPLDNAEIIPGFPGQAETLLALLQGNVDGLTKSGNTSRPGIECGDHTALLSMTMEPPKDFASNAAYVGELDLYEKQEMLLTSHIKVNELGRPLVALPGMEQGTLGCLRDAYDKAANDDQDFLAHADEQNTPIAFVSGDDVENETIEHIKNVPKGVPHSTEERFQSSAVNSRLGVAFLTEGTAGGP